MENLEVLKKMIADILHDVVWLELGLDEAESRMNRAIDALGSKAVQDNWYPYPVYPWPVDPWPVDPYVSHVQPIRDTMISYESFKPYTICDTVTSTGNVTTVSFS